MIRSTMARVASVARTTVRRLRRADGPKAAVKAWAQHGFSMPAPTPVKWNVLMRYGNGTDTWIETGTYLGDTTAKLAEGARHVYSIEPQPDLARAAQIRFGGTRNVTIVPASRRTTSAHCSTKSMARSRCGWTATTRPAIPSKGPSTRPSARRWRRWRNDRSASRR